MGRVCLAFHECLSRRTLLERSVGWVKDSKTIWSAVNLASKPGSQKNVLALNCRSSLAGQAVQAGPGKIVHRSSSTNQKYARALCEIDRKFTRFTWALAFVRWVSALSLCRYDGTDYDVRYASTHYDVSTLLSTMIPRATDGLESSCKYGSSMAGVLTLGYGMATTFQPW
jgi:hypothetical protein